MKKNVVVFIAIFELFFCKMVSASSVDINIIGNNSFDNEINLYLQVNNIVDFSSTCGGVCGFVGNLSYDKSKIELLSMNQLNNFNLTSGNKVVLYRATGVGNGTNILEMKFKNKSLQNNEETTISFNNIVTSDGDNDISANNASKRIKYISKTNPEPPEKPKPIVKPNEKPKPIVKPENDKKEEKLETKKSSNCNLKDISLSYSKLDFDKDKLIYELVVPNNIKNISIKGILEDEKGKITGNGNFSLLDGKNKIELDVIAEDGSNKKYVVNVYRELKEINDNEKENSKISNNNIIYFSIISILILIILILITVIMKNKKK